MRAHRGLLRGEEAQRGVCAAVGWSARFAAEGRQRNPGASVRLLSSTSLAAPVRQVTRADQGTRRRTSDA